MTAVIVTDTLTGEQGIFEGATVALGKVGTGFTVTEPNGEHHNFSYEYFSVKVVTI